MKKIILGSVLAVAAISSANAAATAICSGIPSSAQPVTTDASSFVRTQFTPKCSNNVHLVGDDNQAYFRVGAASTKGKNAFGGSSVGGAVQPYTTCASATGCSATEASAAATNAASS
jgi:hypothetical protein